MLRTAVWRRARRDPIFVGSALCVLVLVLLVIFVPLLNHTDVNAANLTKTLKAPSWAGGDGGLMGTDQLGRDIALRVIHGLRTTFFIGITAVLIGCVVGAIIGLIAGYYGGAADSVLMRLADIQLSFPALLLAMVIVGLLGGGAVTLIIVLGLNDWMLYARVVRGSVLTIRSTELVTGTRSLGATSTRIITRHILPNVLAPVTALMTLEFARLALAEAALSFLGFGVTPPQVSLGAVLSSGRDFIQSQWWIATFAGLVLTVAVLSTNLLGTWLQEAFDPTFAGKDR